ncbi:MAG: hypothetical protein GXX11_00910 [Acholeplasmataceae bacterium]|nr:hypothetical protein [Acholeplasmataceae bacterium]
MGKIGEMIVALGADNANLKKGMKESENIISSTMNVISSMKAELATFGSLATPLVAIKSWAAAVNDLEDKTNLAAESASELLAIGQYVGLSTEDMAMSLSKMSKTAMTAAQSIQTASQSGTESTDVFTKFGIQILDTNGKLLSAEQIFDNVTTKHREMANGLEKTAMEMEIFGRSGAKLNDMLNLSKTEMDNVRNVAQKAGLVLSHDVTQAFEDAEFRGNLAALSIKGIATSIGAQMLPEFKELTGKMQEMSEEFAQLDDDTKRNIAVLLEAAGGVALLSVGWRGLVYLSAPVISAINGISAAYDVLTASAVAAEIAVGGLVLALAAVVATKAYNDFQHYKNGGKFEYDDLGNVTQVEGSADPMPNGSSGSSDDWDLHKEGFDMYDDDLGRKDTTPGNLPFSTSGDGGSTKTPKAPKATKNIQDSIDDITDAWNKMNKTISDSTLTGNAAEIANLSQTAINSIEGVGDKWKKLSLDYSKLSEDDKATFLKNLDDKKIAYEIDGDDQLTFTANTLTEQQAIYKKYYQDLENRHKSCKDIMADIDAAYQENSLAKLQEALTAENAIRLNDYTAQQSMMDTWKEAFLAAHQTTADLVSWIYSTLFNGLSTALSDILTQTQTIGDAIKTLGTSLIKVIADFYAKQLAGIIVTQLMGKKTADKQLDSDVANGAATAAAWWPAAVARSLATAGGNAAPAILGMTATSAAAAALNATLSGITGNKDGGFINGSGTATSDSNLRWLSNGEYVMRASAVRNIGVSNLENLNNGGALPTAIVSGGGISAVATLNNYGDINNGSDLEDLYDEFNSLIGAAIRGA